MKHILSGLIFISVVLLIGVYSYRTLNLYTQAGNNMEILKEKFYICQPFKTKPSENKVVLRIDDMQAFYNSTVLKMINDAFKNQMRVTIGVIPNKIDQDRVVTTFIKENICNMEIAQHGWDHTSSYDANGLETFEFQNIDGINAQSKIMIGKQVLENTFNTHVVSFIPPGDSLSPGTIDALTASGFNIISGQGNRAYDRSISSYDWDTYSTLSAEDILKGCEKDFNYKKMCVIMIHPQDYETNEVLDEVKYANYIKLLSLIQSKGYEVVTFSDMYPKYYDYVPERETEEYLVENSETLWDIAVYYYQDGTRWPEILAVNKDKFQFLPNGSQALVRSNTKILVPLDAK